MYMYIGIEVGTRCNAKCPWCFAEKAAGGTMTLDTFISIIERLETLGFLHKNVMINLYEIGEPFLNNDLPEIFAYLNSKSLKYAVSTNGSVPALFKEGSGILKNLSSLLFSVPGFSQSSYNKIHGFEFEAIKNNIAGLVTNFRDCGFAGDARLIYHVYQFNIDEIYKAKEYADGNKIDFYPYYAILYEWKHVRDYISNTLSYDLLMRASRELFLGNIERAAASRPPDFLCEFYNMLLVDLHGDLKTCCQIRRGDRGYSFGNIFKLSSKEIIEKRTTQAICGECHAMKIDHYLSVYKLFNLCAAGTSQADTAAADRDPAKVLRRHAGKKIVLAGAGEFGLAALRYLEARNIKADFFSDNSPLKIGRRIHGIEVIAPSGIRARCADPLIIITTINHRQVLDQLSGLGLKTSYYFPVDAYTSQDDVNT